MTEQPKNWPEFYITAAQRCPYLPGHTERKVFTHLTHEKTRAYIESLLASGFRRSQNIAYMPHCDGCRACVSVRVLTEEFRPGDSFRRVLRRNDDLVGRRVPNAHSAEQYRLFRAYIEARHGEGGMAEMSALDFAMMIEDSIIATFVTEYRMRPAGGGAGDSHEWHRWPLAAVTLCDLIEDGISMVYSFYDPSEEKRSLGTYMILDHIRQARDLGLKHLYLGYWIEGSPKMSYKARFWPQERLTREGWRRQDLGGGR